jgi:hypothetical protein
VERDADQLRDLERRRYPRRRGKRRDIGSPPSFPAAFATEIQGLCGRRALDFNLQRAPYSNSNDYVEISAPAATRWPTSTAMASATACCSRRSTLYPWTTASSTTSAISSSRAPRWRRRTSAGLAALLMSQGVTDPKAIEAVIERFATTWAKRPRQRTGFGVINPRATIRGMGISK